MVYVFLAEGFEECEALIPVDILRRAHLDVKTVALSGNTVTSSRNVKVVADISIDDINYDDITCVILPGGMPGTLNLYKNEKVKECVKYCFDNELPLCAICAAPLILGRMGYLNGKKAVCYPGFENELTGCSVQSGIVCTDGNIITGKGMGAALKFALEIVTLLKGKEDADKVYNEIQCE